MIQARSTAIAPRQAPALHNQAVGEQTREKGRRPKGLKSLPFLLLAGCFLFSLVIIAQYSSMVTLHYRLGQAETRAETLQEEYRELEKEAARLSSLVRIEVIARSELGMREPEMGQLRVLTASLGGGGAVGE